VDSRVKSLFVTATNTDAGKTYTTIELIRRVAKRGMKVGVCKPIETGVAEIAHDASELLKVSQEFNSNLRSLTPLDITAYTFELAAAPFCADIDDTIEIEQITKKIDELSKLCDILIIEGAGGLMVPITKDFMMIDLIKRLNTQTLLITPSRLGCINDTLLSIEALKSRDIEFDWCVNLFEDIDSFDIVTKPYYDSRFSDWWSIEDGLDRFIDHLLR